MIIWKSWLSRRAKRGQKSTTAFRQGKIVLTALAVTVCLILFFSTHPPPTLVFLSADKEGDTNSHQTLKGTEHRVELYEYNSGIDQSAPWAAWKDFATDSNLLRLADTHLVSRHQIVPIGIAHRQGLLHRGLWMAVLRRDDDNQHYKVLLFERSQTVKTCPGAWGLVGEHSEEGEPWKQTAIRALSEELQLHLDETQQQGLINLLPDHSILVRSDYTQVKRKELQATALFAVVLTQEQISQSRPDAEVASVQWVPIGDLFNNRRQYCNPDISALAALMGRRLREEGFS